jgi:hypothetical protein
MKYLFLSTVIMLSITSCHTKQRQESSGKILTHNSIELKDEFIGNGGFILACKNGLVGFEESSSFLAFYHIKNTESAYVLSRFVNRGQGPNDVLYPLNIQYLNEDTIGVYDIMNMSYYHVPFLKENDSVHIRRSVHFDTRYYRVVKTAYNKYLALSVEDGLFSLLDSDGKLIDKFFEYPYKDENEKSIHNSIRALAYQGTIATSLDAKKCVYASFNGDIIHFYDIQKDHIRLIRKAENAFPDYNIEDNSARTHARSIRGYVSVAATDNFVYALFSGKTIKELLQNSDPMEGQILRIFDWTGTMIKEFHLDVPCKHICVSHDDGTLWAIALIPEVSLVTFLLNEETEKMSGNKNENNNYEVENNIANAKPLSDNDDNNENNVLSDIKRINLKNIYKSKTDTIFSVINDISRVKSIEKTSSDIMVDVQYKNNHTIIYYLTTKEKIGPFSDTITINFENSETLKTNLYGNVVIDNIWK